LDRTTDERNCLYNSRLLSNSIQRFLVRIFNILGHYGMEFRCSFFLRFVWSSICCNRADISFRFIIDAKQREKTYYGLTSDRIIIKSGVFKKSITSINISTLTEIETMKKMTEEEQ
jgi:hypothetical protein